ncbi:hypothetical protein SAMN04488100_13410 [Alkalibacterium putridalgicola]|uniref:Uncharacterized protein n=1 Tax=Alkalibacterium putridalgicola TaxID=426703 RepID=A0A1H7WG21_9LACT|nr:hypothetical protein [Alkalibacterium putridalgicola]GEK90035.1 hypothetical protein APU01nite_20740 [Alkalibacterium putridalgicola]SEM20420.1 hypothetical protein SAMN04488100_13410 [Alkalibacterium putridalgicola]
MKLKLIAAALSFILVLSLGACSDTNGTNNEMNEADNEQNETTNPSSDESYPEPPNLTIHADGEMFSAVMGTYSWTIDNEDGTQTSVEADSASPPELVTTTDPIQVTEDTTVTLDFEEEPESYTVRIWDEDNTILSESDEVDLSGEGEVIYEVWAQWPQGTASYAFSLSID